MIWPLDKCYYPMMHFKAWVVLFAPILGSLLVQASDVVEPSVSPPAGLAPSNTPQVVLLSFDDSITTGMFALVQRVLTNHVNPNGHPIKATFFVSFDSKYDGVSIQRLYADGHEIAVHTLSHATSTNTSLTRWHQEIAGTRRVLSNLAQIPPEEIVGFRAPYLQVNDAAFDVLASRGFLYESSFPEDLSMLSTSPATMIWPYTLHDGLKQTAHPSRKPSTNYPSLFEIPLWNHFTNDVTCTVMDPPATFDSNQVMALWQSNFLYHYNGNRAPFSLALHATSTNQWLSHSEHASWRIQALNDFITWALTQSNTWLLSYRNLVDYMRDPIPASEVSTNASFLSDTKTYITNTTCSYPNSHSFRVCGPCPPAAPAYSNAYYGFAPLAGGLLNISFVSQSPSNTYYSMLISNDTTNAVYNWATAFTISAGKVVFTNYDVTLAQASNLVTTAAKQYVRFIAPGGTRSSVFTVNTTNAVVISDYQVHLFQLGPSGIVLTPLANSSQGIQWSDNAHEYSVEWSSNLMENGWTEATNELFRLFFTNTPPGPVNPLFYRVKGTIY